MYVKVQAVTKAKEEKLEEVKPLYLKICVREKPERNLANTRIVSMVASFYGVGEEKVRIISGHHHHSKMLSISVKKDEK
jgi:uncharacterized protein YggU (UPF0235/DUF167 family)